MNRKDKIKLLQDVAKGDSSGLLKINKCLSVVFIDFINDEPKWIEQDVFINLSINGSLNEEEYNKYGVKRKTDEEILNDHSIRKYNSTELRQLRKRRFVFEMPWGMLGDTDQDSSD
jgi:hypothetical protein